MKLATSTLTATLILLAGLTARADGAPQATDRLRELIRQETEVRCRLGNFNFESKKLLSQIDNLLAETGIATENIVDCDTLAAEIAGNMQPAELEALMATFDEGAMAQRHRELKDAMDQPKILRIIADGIYFGTLDFRATR